MMKEEDNDEGDDDDGDTDGDDNENGDDNNCLSPFLFVNLSVQLSVLFQSCFCHYFH